MIQQESVNTKGIPEWLAKCLSCKHVYTTKDDDEIKCRCRNGCKYKNAKDSSL